MFKQLILLKINYKIYFWKTFLCCKFKNSLFINCLKFILENFYDLYNALYCNFVLFCCCCSEVLLSA